MEIRLKNIRTGQLNNEGFSLVELIVAVLISSVVMLAVVGLITVSMNAYRQTNDETVMQIEAQAGIYRVNDLLIEATDYCYFSNGVTNNVGCRRHDFTIAGDRLLVIAANVDTIEYWYFIVFDSANERLLLYKSEADHSLGFSSKLNSQEFEDYVFDESGPFNYVKDTLGQKALLAEYITDFDITHLSGSAYSSRLLRIDMSLQKGEQSFRTQKNVSLRNY